MIEYIESNLDQDLSLVELARIADFSVSHFKPMFKQATGVPVHRFVMERRVERARVLLLEGRHSITDIALGKPVLPIRATWPAACVGYWARARRRLPRSSDGREG